MSIHKKLRGKYLYLMFLAITAFVLVCKWTGATVWLTLAIGLPLSGFLGCLSAELDLKR